VNDEKKDTHLSAKEILSAGIKKKNLIIWKR